MFIEHIISTSYKNTPFTQVPTSLPIHEFTPDPPGNGSHSIFTSRDVDILSQITYFVNRTNYCCSASSEHFEKGVGIYGILNLFHCYRPFHYPHLAREIW